VNTGGDTLRRAFDAMASACELQLEGSAMPVLETAAATAEAEVRRIEAKYSRYRSDSVVSRINAGAGAAQAVTVDEETAALLDFAGQLHAQSGGAFDITSGVLRRAWNFRSCVPPAPQAVQALLPLIGFGAVERPDRHRVRLPQAGMEVDFGGFGKEYAADRAAAVLRAAGVACGFVNLGGDIRVVGAHRDGSPWRFGIQHPRRPAETIASVELCDGALATSGDYERFFEHGGVRYCHVLDPRTGWPVRHWQSVSATAPLAVAAGALCTIAMLLGADAPAFLAAQQADHLLVDSDGTPSASTLSGASGSTAMSLGTGIGGRWASRSRGIE
jgi:FAD:protein FMN transferase